MFDELLNLSKKIISCYQELEKLVTEVTITSQTNFKVNQDKVMKNPYVYANLIKLYNSFADKFNTCMAMSIKAKIDELSELIILENKLLNSSGEDETNNFIKWLEGIDTGNDKCISRLRERLMVREYILEGYSFKGSKILQSTTLKDMNFYNKEFLPCIIKIEVFKRLNQKIKELSNTKDFLFIRELHKLYEKKKFDEMKNNGLMELIIFMFDCNIELVPSLDDSDIQGLEDIYVDNDNIIVDWALDLTDDIASINSDTNDIGVFFELLYNYTYLEVLMDYMVLDELEEFRNAALDYDADVLEFECESNNLCKLAHDENKNPNMKLVRMLVSRRLDEEKN